MHPCISIRRSIHPLICLSRFRECISTSLSKRKSRRISRSQVNTKSFHHHDAWALFLPALRFTRRWVDKSELTYAGLARLGVLSDFNEIFSFFSMLYSSQVYVCSSMLLKELSIKRKQQSWYAFPLLSWARIIVKMSGFHIDFPYIDHTQLQFMFMIHIGIELTPRII